MTGRYVLGDVTADLLAFLRAQHAIQLLGATLSTDLVGWDETTPWGTVVQIGGGSPPDANPVLYYRTVKFQLDFYGPDRETSGRLGETVVAYLYALNDGGGYRGAGAALVDAYLTMDLGWLPDPLTFKPRWTATCDIGAVPLQQVS